MRRISTPFPIRIDGWGSSQSRLSIHMSSQLPTVATGAAGMEMLKGATRSAIDSLHVVYRCWSSRRKRRKRRERECDCAGERRQPHLYMAVFAESLTYEHSGWGVTEPAGDDAGIGRW
jgi:hypothetical protein